MFSSIQIDSSSSSFPTFAAAIPGIARTLCAQRPGGHCDCCSRHNQALPTARCALYGDAVQCGNPVAMLVEAAL